MGTLISFIIPVYNVEKLLKECLDSILSQNHSDFEVLLVNDGSTDQSGILCDQYSENDTRFRVFHQKNKGVSAARNLGIENAKGEWITFVDSDDWIGYDYMNCFQSNLNEEIDWIFVDVCKKTLDGKEFKILFPQGELNRNTFVENYTIHPHFFSPWAKFFRRSLIIKNKLRFDINLNYGEDTIFNCEYILLINKIYFSGNTFYYQRVVETGLSSKPAKIENDQYKYNKLFHILSEMLISKNKFEINIYPSASRYLLSIINSKTSFLYKYRLAKKLLKSHKQMFIEDLSKGSKGGQFLAFLLRFNFYFAFILILNYK